MNSTNSEGQRSDTVCRPADWTDIVKFFLLNYALHALTVVTSPGGSWLINAVGCITAVFMPIFGLSRAAIVLRRFAIRGQTDLDVALRAQALCMVVPRELAEDYDIIEPDVRLIHGQHPVISPKTALLGESGAGDTSAECATSPGEEELENTTQNHAHSRDGPSSQDVENGQAINDYCLVLVPSWYTVSPIIPLQLGDSTIPPTSYNRSLSPRRRQPSIKDLLKVLKKSRRIFTKKKILEKINKIKKVLLRRGVGRVTAPQISCNYSVIKTVAALLQILYGSFELYKARGDQLDKYGYAAYSLTVIPYLLMSIANLLANLSSPQYPSLYLVFYRDTKEPDTRGETASDSLAKSQSTTLEAGENTERIEPPVRVGPSSPNPTNYSEKDDYSEPTSVTPSKWQEIEDMVSGAVGIVHKEKRDRHKETVSGNLILLFMLCLLAAPYIIINALTGFNARQSTPSQRSWVMCWIVIGQIGGFLSAIATNFTPLGRISEGSPAVRLCVRTLVTIVFSVSTIGGFVVVAQMISSDPVCSRV